MIEQLKKLPLGKIQQFKIPIALSLVGLVLILGGILLQPKSPPSKSFPKESIIDGIKLISVDVSGAVKNPGVYKLKSDARVEDAVKVSGGFSENANHEYISKYLNLAQKLSDGSKIYIPFTQDSASLGGYSGQGGVVVGTQTQAKPNINTATQSELEALPGIGPVTASKIISGRPYQNVEELLSKKVVSKSVFGKIKDQIVVY